MVIESPWERRFEGLLTSESIRARAEHIPAPIADLDSMPVHLAEEELKSQLQRVVVLSNSDLEYLSRLVSRSHAYTVKAYPSVRHYIHALHAEELQPPDFEPVCLTGLAGVGKSTFLTALERALPPPADLYVGSVVHGGHLPYRSSVRVRVDAGTSLTDVLKHWLPREFVSQPVPAGQADELLKDTSVRISTKNLVPRALRYSYRMGFAANLIDEMQFMTQNASSNARLTQFLLTMTYLKVPLVYAANFSMCHKLIQRNQEDKDRLLAKTIVLRPLELNEAGLGALLRAYDQVLSPCVQGSLLDLLPHYAAMTLGIKRKIKDLTVAAFVVMRKQGDRYLQAGHLKRAYEKHMSAAFRTDVENLFTQYSTGKPVRGRSDLWCPFGYEQDELHDLSAMASQDFEQRIGHQLLRQSLTANEKLLVRAMEHGVTAPPVKTVTTVPPKRTRKAQLTASELLANTLAYKEG